MCSVLVCARSARVEQQLVQIWTYRAEVQCSRSSCSNRLRSPLLVASLLVSREVPAIAVAVGRMGQISAERAMTERAMTEIAELTLSKSKSACRFDRSRLGIPGSRLLHASSLVSAGREELSALSKLTFLLTASAGHPHRSSSSH